MQASDSSSGELAEFRAFLQRAAAGQVGVEDWNRHALRRYDEPRVESARKQLVQGGLSIGQCSARPVPPGLEQLAADLLADL